MKRPELTRRWLGVFGGWGVGTSTFLVRDANAGEEQKVKGVKGKKIEWDARNLVATNAPEVAHIVKQEYHNGYKLEG